MPMDGEMSDLGLDVSRETLDRLKWFEAQVRKWTPAINLISPNTLPDLWTRHICDSAQVFSLAPPCTSWLDIGSGGGFPGLVIAILARDLSPDTHVTLMDSDQRKCAFLRTVIREADLNASVIAERVEQVAPQGAEVLSARALARLDHLFEFADRHLALSGVALFQKGETWETERAELRGRWRFDMEAIKSKTEPKAVILRTRNILRET